jgi:hypothetical protein
MVGTESCADHREDGHEVQDPTKWRLPGVRAPVRQDSLQLVTIMVTVTDWTIWMPLVELAVTWNW